MTQEQHQDRKDKTVKRSEEEGIEKRNEHSEKLEKKDVVCTKNLK